MAREPSNEGAGREVAEQTVCPSCNGTWEAERSICPDDGAGLLLVPDAPLLTGRRLDDRYDVGGVVGSGGMSVVYRGRQRAMEREVAIKVLHPQYAHDPRSVRRFFREAQAASRLVHPNVVTVYDFGRSREGELYLVMELLEGWSLGDLIHHRAPLPLASAVSLALQVVGALEAAHRRRIVHRDLKPDNVQLVVRDGRVQGKVLDFGIARAVRDPEGDDGAGAHPSTVDVAGTPAYMSPEQILGRPPDPRTDLYSLGVILYEMLTGERPFADEHQVTLCMRQLNEDPPELGSHPDVEELPEALEELVRRMLAKRSEDRPASATAVREALEALPIEAVAPVARPGEGPAGGDDTPTRPDAGVAMGLPTRDVRTAASLASESARAGAETEALAARPGQRPAEGARPGRTSASAAGTGRDEGEPSSMPPLAVAHVLLADRGDERRAAVTAWAEERRAEGWRIAHDRPATRAEGRPATRAEGDGDAGAATRLEVAVPSGLGVTADRAARLLLRRLDLLREASRSEGWALRLGADASLERPAEPAELSDRTRLLAARAGDGELVVPEALARALGPEEGAGGERAEGAGRSGEDRAAVVAEGGEPIPCRTLPAGRPLGEVGRPRPFVGREAEHRRLERLAAEARRGGTLLAQLVGERGVGRTAMLQAFGAGRRHCYLRASPLAWAWPGQTAARLARHCLGLDERAGAEDVRARLEPLADGVARPLARLLLEEPAPGEGSAPAIARALVELLDREAGGGPLALLLDDAQRLDPASRELLVERLPEEAASRPWLVVAAEADVPQRRDEARDGAGHVVPLRPLGVRASTELLESLGVEVGRRGELLARGGGNPLALRLLAGLPADAGLPEAGRVVARLLPRHLRGLSARAATSAWLRAAVGAEEPTADLAVRSARLYLEHGLTPELRRWLHGRLQARDGLHAVLARGLESEPDRAASWRAYRAEALGLWRRAAEEAEAVADAGLAVEAARLRVRAGDVTGGLEQYEVALAEDGATPDRRARMRFGAALLDAGDDETAEQILAGVREGFGGAEMGEPAEPDGGAPGEGAGDEAADEPDALLVGRLTALLARCAVRRNDVEEAMVRLGRAREALRLIEPADPARARSLEALVQEVRAEVALAESDLEGTRTNLEQARDAFRDLGRTREALRCLVELGRVELDARAYARAEETLRAAAHLANAAGLPTELRRARVGLGEALVACGRPEEGTSLLRRVLRQAHRDPRTLAEAAAGLASAVLSRDVPADAERYAERALEVARSPAKPSEAVRARAQLALSEAHRRAGEAQRARRAAAEAQRAAADAGHGLLRDRAEELEEALVLEQGRRAPVATSTAA